MTLKYLSVFLAVFACVTSATSSDLNPKNDPLLPTKAPRVLTSDQDMLNYAKEISAINPKDHQRILAMAYPDPVIKLSSLCSISDLEHYKFQRLFALNGAYKALIEQNTMNTALCIRYHETNIAELTVYRHDFGKFRSQHESVNEQVTFGMFYVSQTLGDSFFEMSALQNTPDQQEEAKKSLNASIEVYKEAVGYGRSEHLSRLPKPKRSVVEDSVLKIQKNLVSAYSMLAQSALLKNEENSYVEKARRYCENLKNQKDLFESASKDLQLMEEALRLKRLASMPAGSRSVEKKRKQAMGQTQIRLSTTTETFQNGFRDGIDTKLIKLSGLLNSKESGWSANLVKGLIEIEDHVKAQLINKTTLSSSSSVSEVPLDVIYRNLHTLLGRARFSACFWHYIPAFFLTNDLEGGITRIEAINNIEKNQTGNISYKSRFVAAALKNLVGDHDEWIALEEELTAIDNKLKAKKKEAKKRAHERKIEEIERSRVVPDTKSEEKVPPTATPSLPTQPNKANGMEEFDLPSESEISAKQRKLEKLERHEQAEKERTAGIPEKEKTQKQSASNSSALLPLSKKQRRDLILQSSNKSLAELYNLSSGPLKVDQEIENNTWRFTREQFHNYVEVMGCTCKGGNGIHTKASLPKAMRIVHGDTLITIMNDFGGALTLPLWDKDYVPDYLQKQILEARKNLRALKIVALQTN